LCAEALALQGWCELNLYQIPFIGITRDLQKSNGLVGEQNDLRTVESKKDSAHILFEGWD
jgi:hypothetical protein